MRGRAKACPCNELSQQLSDDWAVEPLPSLGYVQASLAGLHFAFFLHPRRGSQSKGGEPLLGYSRSSLRDWEALT
jgi:hypothetical protein